MTKKAYIVANEKQEREVLKKFERDGIVWVAGIEKPTEWIPSQLEGAFTAGFPYALVIDNKGRVSWSNIRNLTNQKIVFDGRKEEQMSDKYVVSQEFMNELMEWKSHLFIEEDYYIDQEAINSMPKIIKNWWLNDYVRVAECNKRLVSIIRYMNGANDFEVEKPKKWVVQSKETDSEGSHLYLFLGNHNAVPVITTCFGLVNATKFGTKEEAESWANSHQEVVEVGE